MRILSGVPGEKKLLRPKEKAIGGVTVFMNPRSETNRSSQSLHATNNDPPDEPIDLNAMLEGLPQELGDGIGNGVRENGDSYQMQEFEKTVGNHEEVVERSDSHGDADPSTTNNDPCSTSSEVIDGTAGAPPYNGGDDPLGIEPSAEWLEGTRYQFAVSPPHPASALFPRGPEDNIIELAEDIRKHGLREAITRYLGETLDGRNRELACWLVGVAPRYQEWDGRGSAMCYVVSRNLMRRHLNDQERALIAAKISKELEEEAKGRSRANLQRTPKTVDGLDPTHRGQGRSAERAAKLLNVSPDATKKAARVLAKGTPAVIEATSKCKVSLDAAATIAGLSEQEQNEALMQGNVAAIAKFVRSQKKQKGGKHRASPKTQQECGEPNHAQVGFNGTHCPQVGPVDTMKKALENHANPQSQRFDEAWSVILEGGSKLEENAKATRIQDLANAWGLNVCITY